MIGYLVGAALGFIALYFCVWIIASVICWKTRIGTWGTWGKVGAVILSIFITGLLLFTLIGYLIIGLYGGIKWLEIKKQNSTNGVTR